MKGYPLIILTALTRLLHFGKYCTLIRIPSSPLPNAIRSFKTLMKPQITVTYVSWPIPLKVKTIQLYHYRVPPSFTIQAELFEWSLADSPLALRTPYFSRTRRCGRCPACCLPRRSRPCCAGGSTGSRAQGAADPSALLAPGWPGRGPEPPNWRAPPAWLA